MALKSDQEAQKSALIGGLIYLPIFHDFSFYWQPRFLPINDFSATYRRATGYKIKW